MKMRWQPAVRVAPPYHDDPVYIEALAHSLEAELARLDFEPDVIVASFHGMPRGLPAQGRSLSLPVREDGAAAARAARLDDEQLMLTFQSRFGSAEWLKPYTDET